ncbi:hypothetical protein BH09ACT5_BH09ACT5_21620 [soil metagenome]
MSMRALGAALAIGLGLAGSAVAPATAADDGSVVRLALAVPIVVPASADEFLDAETLGLYTSQLGLLTRQLDDVVNRPVALGVDPRIIASIRILGSSAPPSALAWLERLDAATNPTFSLGWADADVTLQTQSGAGSVLQHETFDFAIDPALFAPAPGTASPQPTPTAGDDSLPALPTSDGILAWPYTLSGIAWPRDDTAIAADLPKIAASGYTTTILSSRNVARDASAGPAVQVDGTGVLVSDSAVSAALRSAASAQLPAEWEAAVRELSSAISAGARVQPGSATLFATFDRAILPLGNRLADTLSALAADPSVELVPLAQALGADPAAATVIDEPQPADRVSRAGQMIEGANAERQFASVANDPAAITSDRRLELLTLLSAEWDDDLEGWPTAADAFTTASIDLRNSVHLVTSSNFLLVADNDQYLPITVNNALPQAVTVYITVHSQSSLLVIDENRVKLEIEAGAQAKKNVPVHSLSNGVVEVDVSLTSSTGVAIGAPISSEVNVQAGWETPIVVAVAVLVVVVFGVGVVRTVLRRRKAARLGTDGD